MSHQIQPIPTVERYFGTSKIPIITQEFHSQKGWRTTNYKKRVSRSWLRKLKAEDITHVQLEGRADFSIEELLP